MKIAFLNIYCGRVLRGSEIFVHELAEKLSSHHSVWVFHSGTITHHLYKTVKISHLPFLTHQQGILASFLYTLVVLLFTLRCFPKLLREDFDWVIPINGRFQVFLCRFLRLIKGTKILISGHSGIGFDERVNIIIGKPDVFVALSQKAADWARYINKKQKVVYIPNGIDSNVFNPNVQPKRLQLKNPIVLCVSALVPYKRIHLLIEAVAKLGSVSLLILGDGPQKEEILRMGKAKLSDRFMLLSHVPHIRMPSYYRASYVFSLPSEEYESFGLAYLEALACNIPVVAPDDRNRKDIIGDAGLYCNVSNIDQYADALKKALHTDFGDRPLQRATRFSWQRIAKQYEEVLRN